MQIFYTDMEQAYRPTRSFFYGRFTPYPEVPGRTRSILDGLSELPGIEVHTPPALDPQVLESVHSRRYLEALTSACERLRADEEFFPFNMQRLPLLLESPHPRLRVGYFALDGSTPLVPLSYRVAVAVAATAVAGALAVIGGQRLVYALPRPPGHHAGRESYCGYCLVNHAAVAASVLSKQGKVAILDVDYHHGNGTQDIFWERDDVLYVSLHCRPEEAYPYVAGAVGETGGGVGLGANRNLPLPGGTRWPAYAPALEQALEAVERFDPASVVLSLGFDTLGTDPIGSFALSVDDFTAMGHRIAQLGRPMLVVQEGGYDVPQLGACARAFFLGLGVLGATE